ncbi:MAG: hypothetical protein P1U35_13565 [Cycloclasticus sp.]|nr:hypothetical protein [Cycloclasticus sp.]
MDYDNDYSGWGNEVLYKMCAERPLHDDVDTITGKLWIIGRSYSAAIERKAGKDFRIEDAAEILIESEIDQKIEELKKIDRPNNENIEVILEAHKHVTDVLSKATGIEKRSLASKYLHCHSPRSVFIYDSIANGNIRKRLNPIKPRFIVPKGFDGSYSSFAYRCIYYRDTVLEPELGKSATPRRVDMELLGYGIPNK